MSDREALIELCHIFFTESLNETPIILSTIPMNLSTSQLQQLQHTQLSAASLPAAPALGLTHIYKPPLLQPNPQPALPHRPNLRQRQTRALRPRRAQHARRLGRCGALVELKQPDRRVAVEIDVPAGDGFLGTRSQC